MDRDALFSFFIYLPHLSRVITFALLDLLGLLGGYMK